MSKNSENSAATTRTAHLSDCARHNEPAYPNGLCDCGAHIERNYSQQVRADAREAARLIRLGWHQGSLHPAMTGRDIDTAIVEACSTYVDTLNLMNAVVNEIGDQDISRWNNAPGRTKVEVLTMLENISTNP